MQEAAQAAEPVSEIGEPAALARTLAVNDSLLAVREDEHHGLTLTQRAKQRLARVGGVMKG